MNKLKVRNKIPAMILVIMLAIGMMSIAAYAAENTFTVQGKVTVPDDTPGVEVALISIWEYNPDTQEVGERLNRVSTDADGNYTITGIAAGSYRIDAGQSGYTYTEIDISLSVEEYQNYTANIDFDLVNDDFGIEPTVSITQQPATEITVTEGNISDNLSVLATVQANVASRTDITLAYKWFQNTTGKAIDGTEIGTGATLAIPTNLTNGTYYFYCVVSSDSILDVTSMVAKVIVNSSGTTTPTTTPDTPPADNPSSWAVEQVTAATELGLVPPELRSLYTQATTRAEFCALAVALYEAATGGEITERSTFTDTTDINVEKAAAISVVSGVGDNMFSPDTQLTREQAAAMLSRLAEAVGKPLEANAATFADNDSISDWAAGQVGQIQAAGIMGGVGANTFAPQDPYTREQSIITIMRLYDYVTGA